MRITWGIHVSYNGSAPPALLRLSSTAIILNFPILGKRICRGREESLGLTEHELMGDVEGNFGL
jgi:hypothetical protein